jgi:hypothetical protein
MAKFNIEVHQIDSPSPGQNGWEWAYRSAVVPRIGDTLVSRSKSQKTAQGTYRHYPDRVWEVRNVQWVFKRDEVVGEVVDAVMVWVKFACLSSGSLEPRILADNAASKQNRPS